MKKFISLFASVFLLSTPQAPAADDSPPSSSVAGSSLFRPNELALDLYGTYTASEPNGIGNLFSTNLRHGKFGAGLGVTYWITRNFGAGLDVTVPQVDDVHGALFDQVSLSFEARLPIGPVAPYSFAGAGRNFENGSWNTHAGLGLEWRFHQSAAVFMDARYVFASHGTDSLMMRAGVRFPF